MLFVVGGVERLLGGSFGKVLRSSGVRCWEGPRDFWEAPVERPVKGLAECTHIYTSKYFFVWKKQPIEINTYLERISSSTFFLAFKSCILFEFYNHFRFTRAHKLLPVNYVWDYCMIHKVKNRRLKIFSTFRFFEHVWEWNVYILLIQFQRCPIAILTSVSEVSGVKVRYCRQFPRCPG